VWWGKGACGWCEGWTVVARWLAVARLRVGDWGRPACPSGGGDPWHLRGQENAGAARAGVRRRPTGEVRIWSADLFPACRR
jgi:hypothetical protein